jgi:class 3 adenylate cyclase
MAGIFGSPWKKEYTVFGAPVNLAERLEKLALGGQILICGETARLVANLVRMEEIPSPILRGLDHPSDVFSVLGKRQGDQESCLEKMSLPEFNGNRP